MNQKFCEVLEELNIPFYMATGSPCRIKDERTTFSRLPASKAASTNRSLRLPLQTRLGDVSKGPPRQTHPLINNTTFHFQAPRRHSRICSNRKPYGTFSPINQITPPRSSLFATPPPCFEQTFVSSAITTMRQTARQRCGDETTRWRRFGSANTSHRRAI